MRVVRQPVFLRPVVRRPVVHRPVVRRPVVRRPVVRQPVVHRPVVRWPVVHRPVVRRPVVPDLGWGCWWTMGVGGNSVTPYGSIDLFSKFTNHQGFCDILILRIILLILRLYAV